MSSSPPAHPSTGTGTGRRSLATNKFTGGVRVWHKEDRILVGKKIMAGDLEESALENMSLGRSWKGKGKGYPGQVCCFGEGGCPYRVIAIEVGDGFEVADIIVVCIWAVSDHDAYQGWLSKQRSNGFTQLTTVIAQCLEDWRQNAEAVHINGDGESRPIQEAVALRRVNSEHKPRPSRQWPGSDRTAEAPGRLESSDDDSSSERIRFTWFQKHGSSIVRRFKKANVSAKITDSKLWKTLGRDSPPRSPSEKRRGLFRRRK